MKDPLFISFATQKGGAGKSTLTAVVASYLYYNKGKKLLVVDCDYPQHSIKEMRDRDVEAAEINPALKKAMKEHTDRMGGAYPLLMCRPEEAMQKVQKYLEDDNECELVLFDLPGTINNTGVAKIVSLMDHLFCPVTADLVVLESSLAFAMKVRDEIMSLNGSSIKSLHMVWTKVDRREKTRLYDRYEEIFEDELLPTLKTRLPDSKRFNREGDGDVVRTVFRSTFMPPAKKLLRGSRLVELVEEISGIINL